MRVRCRRARWRHDHALPQAQRALIVEHRLIDATQYGRPFQSIPTLVWESLPTAPALLTVVLRGLHAVLFYRLEA
jgi:hypothetical protein